MPHTTAAFLVIMHKMVPQSSAALINFGDSAMNNQINKLNIVSLRGGDWYSIGKLVTETIKKKGWKPGQAVLVDWMSRASEDTGLSLNTIGRMVAVYEFITQIAPSEANEEQACRYPFSSLEILKRIHAIAPSQTRSLLKAISNKELSMRDLRLKLKSIQLVQPKGESNRRSTSIRNYMEFHKLAIYTISNSLSEFRCPDNYEFADIKKPAFGKSQNLLDIFIPTPDALAFDRNSINNRSTAFELFYLDDKAADLMAHRFRLVTHFCYMSSFFSKLFLILPGSVNQDIAQGIANNFIGTQRLNVGVALLKPQNKRSSDNFIFLSRPVDNESPVPDCRAMVDWDSVVT